jgi:hypothetical protein
MVDLVEDGGGLDGAQFLEAFFTGGVVSRVDSGKAGWMNEEKELPVLFQEVLIFVVFKFCELVQVFTFEAVFMR